MDKHQNILKNLNSAIATTVENREQFVINPKKDLTRNRKLDAENLLRLLLSMKGGSLDSELKSYFANKQYAASLLGKTVPLVEVTPSALVQQRNKLSWKAFENIFNDFNTRCGDKSKYKGYNLFAVDGTALNISRNPNDKDSYHPSQDYTSCISI